LQPPTILAAAAGATVLAATGAVSAAFANTAVADKKFPKTSDGEWRRRPQIEGNNVNADFWLLEISSRRVRGALRRMRATVITARGDIALLAGLGFNSYRFSLDGRESSRPEAVFGAELDYYKRVIEC